eukprot:5722896-Prorocentrum_lima.AAC.1
MTSSLVGSEMCIRDRPLASSAFPSLLISHGGSAMSIDACSPRSLDTLSTVSYTHLTLPTICSV